ncbi:MAG: hypothetical protein G3M70_02510 [Candidatus Nitronauta litoralis]|uniref:Uncharacterized protein n=1 Tax=Candidatus Nitronauta litoralis TaxID=2705533 RepID=A0A7T0BTZ1_9BACT|nr:MAG: hypothetical protein G3M70_02510 [Candidatus Nitronauta litoralis]
MSQKKKINWNAIAAIAGIISVLVAVGFGVNQILSEEKTSPSIQTSGDNSPVIYGNKGNVDVD